MINEDERTAQRNEAILDGITNPGSGMQKRAYDAMNGYIRTKLLEDSFMRTILPAIPITNDDLSESLTERKPWKIIEKEPDATGAMTIQFGTTPNALFLEGKKFPVYFNRITTERYIKDVDELRLWRMDIRQVLCDQQMKWIAFEEDRRFIDGINTALQAPGEMAPATGVVQWESFSGGFTRSNVIDASTIMPRTPSHLEPDKALVNTITRRELLKWDRIEMGANFAEEILFKGWTDEKLLNMNWIATIKRELVPDGRMYMFAEPKFIGKHYLLEDTTMYVKNEAFYVSWFMYKSSGAAIGNLSGLACADFNPQGLSNNAQAAVFA